MKALALWICVLLTCVLAGCVGEESADPVSTTGDEDTVSQTENPTEQDEESDIEPDDNNSPPPVTDEEVIPEESADSPLQEESPQDEAPPEDTETGEDTPSEDQGNDPPEPGTPNSDNNEPADETEPTTDNDEEEIAEAPVPGFSHIDIVNATSTTDRHLAGHRLEVEYALDEGTPVQVQVSYQWQRNGAAIIGATGSQYTLTENDIPSRIRVRLLATNTQTQTSSGYQLSDEVATGGKSFYVDPVNGADNNTGSADSPWQSLQTVLDQGLIASRDWESKPPSSSTPLVVKREDAPVQPGDSIVLRSGNHGPLFIRGYYNAAPIYVVAAEGATPRFDFVEIRSSSHWVIRGITIEMAEDRRHEYEDYFYNSYSVSRLLRIANHNHTGPVHNITVADSTIQSAASISGWTAYDWDAKAMSGLAIYGEHHDIRNNHFRHVAFGMDVGATHSMIVGNTINHFSYDGIRSIGSDYTTFENNLIKNSYGLGELNHKNHDDGFQNFSHHGSTTGVVFRGNTIIHFENPDRPLITPLQGFGAFDAPIIGWTIENNLIVTDHVRHGLTVMGAQDTVIRGNIIRDPNGQESIGTSMTGTASIQVVKAKPNRESAPSTNVTVECNIAPHIGIESGQSSVVSRHNVHSNDPQTQFDENCNLSGPPSL